MKKPHKFTCDTNFKHTLTSIHGNDQIESLLKKSGPN